MTEAERLERLAKQLAVLALELKAMGRSSIGWQVNDLAEQLMRQSVEITQGQVQALADKLEAGTDQGG